MFTGTTNEYISRHEVFFKLFLKRPREGKSGPFSIVFQEFLQFLFHRPQLVSLVLSDWGKKKSEMM